MQQPQYLLGLLVGVAYFWLFALRFFLRAGDRTRWMEAPLEGVTDFLPAVHLSVALFIAVAVSLWWLVPFGKSSLDLKETELHVLLAAPIPRRHILQYAVLKNPTRDPHRVPHHLVLLGVPFRRGFLVALPHGVDVAVAPGTCMREAAACGSPSSVSFPRRPPGGDGWR